MSEPHSPAPSPAHKKRLGRGRRLLRLIGGAFDPRAYLHALKLVNYYNYSHVQPRRAVNLGKNVNISPNVTFANAERIEIGDRVSIGARCTLWAGPANAWIRVGNDVLFGPEIMITASNYRFNDGQPVTAQAMDEADVVIGDDVWLGARAIILPGARIGSGAIIGAGALVKNDIPDFAIAVGAPARVVGYRKVTSD